MSLGSPFWGRRVHVNVHEQESKITTQLHVIIPGGYHNIRHSVTVYVSVGIP
jgi:hypothetical protein